MLVERPEPTVLAVAHALPIRYLLWAADGRTPAARIEPVPHAEPVRLAARHVRMAVELLHQWAREPAFRPSQ
jgi:broad specificity phosphatase PhoE